MAALDARNPTLLDLAKASDPNGKIAVIAEILDETNEILLDMSWIEGNLPTGHRSVMRTGIPTPTWRKLNEGVQPNKATTVPQTDNTGMLEAYAEVDKALADLNGNTNAFRLSEDRAHIEGINQELADTVFYGNEGTEPEAFTGLAPRYNDLSAESADNIIAGGGTGTDNASIWLVVWGSNTIHGIVPKGSKAGLQIEDKGQVTIQDASNGSNTGRMEAYQTHYRFDAGLVVRDWRYAVRIANIDKSALSIVFTSGVFTTSSAHLPNLMFQAMRLIPNLNMGRPAFYMSRDIATTVAQQLAAATQASTLTADRLGGDNRFTERFHGIPMRRCDALSADEALVT
jgi:hypothetical protein